MTKDRILSILKGSEGYVSGEAISREIGVSRAAVNKAVRSLMAEGYEIDSVNNRGYCLKSSPDILSKAGLMGLLPEERLSDIYCCDSISSTNLKLNELAFEGACDGTVVIANEQTGGRGRRGRSFASPRDKGIYLSYLMRRSGTPETATEITAWTAVAAARAIETVCGVSVSIKWVNDLLINKKKICGILTEMSVENESRSIQSIIIGIGINVNEEPADFDESIRDIASSILTETGKAVKRAELAAELVRRLDKMNRDFPDEKKEYLDLYRQRSIIRGQRILINPLAGAGSEDLITHVSKREATAEGINEDFSLHVRYDDSAEEDINSGEVSIRGIYGYI